MSLLSIQAQHKEYRNTVTAYPQAILHWRGRTRCLAASAEHLPLLNPCTERTNAEELHVLTFKDSRVVSCNGPNVSPGAPGKH